MNEFIKTCCENFEKEFVEKMLPMPFIAKGILASEGFAFCAIAKHLKTSLVVESGVWWGQSTQIWAKFFDDSKVIAVDRKLLTETKEKFKSFLNVTLKQGNGVNLLPEIIEINSNEKISVFIDGPKGMNAIDLAKKCLEFKNVLMVGLHDFHTIIKNPKLAHQGRNIRRIKLEEMGIADFFTDDFDFIQAYSYMDNSQNFIGQGDDDLYWVPYWLMSKRTGKKATFGSYGPTIAFILKK